MAIDVIIPGTTPWVFTNAALAPGETVETAVGLNSMYMAAAEMVSRGYIAGAQLKQAAADVNADKEKLAMLQSIKDGSFGALDFSSTDAAMANTALLQSLGADTSDPRYPQVATTIGPRISGWATNPFTGERYPQFTSSQIEIKLPALTYDQSTPLDRLMAEPVPYDGQINAVYRYPASGNLFYVVKSPSGQFYQMALNNPVQTASLTGIPTDPALKAQLAASVDPAKLDAEIEKTVQISQGKQTYLQTLTTDYSTFMTTASNLLQEYYKVLTSMMQRIG